MAGPNLEVVRFGFYLFFPVAMMLKFGDPEWYNTYVVPYGKKIWPDWEKTNKPPHTSAEIQSELARFKQERREKKLNRAAAAAEAQGGFESSQPPVATSSSSSNPPSRLV